MENQVTCKKCESTQVTVQKVGFNIKKSFLGFLWIAIIVGIIWAVLISAQNRENELNNKMEQVDHYNEIMNRYDGRVYTPANYAENKALWLATAFILASSFLFGFKGANENQIVCLKCGNSQPIGEQE